MGSNTEKAAGITRGGRIIIGIGIALVVGATGYVTGSMVYDASQPRHVYAADLNQDGKTDYAVRCETCFAGDSEDYILLSMPDGTYKRESYHGAKGIVKKRLEELAGQ